MVKDGTRRARVNAVARVAELTRMGLSAQQIAAECGIAVHSVYVYRNQAGVSAARSVRAPKQPSEQNRRVAERRERIKKLAGQGLNTDQIAAALGIRPGKVNEDMVVLRKLAAKNWEPAPALVAYTRDSRTNQRREKVRELSDRGMKAKDIAVELGISESRAYQFLRAPV